MAWKAAPISYSLCRTHQRPFRSISSTLHQLATFVGMYPESLRLELSGQVLKLGHAAALITAQLRIPLFLNCVDSQWHLFLCHLQQPLVLLLVHLVQAVHYLDLHLAFLPSCLVGSRRQTY